VTRPLFAAGAAVATLVLAGAASGARGFSDPAGDANTAPDVTSVGVTEATAGVVTIELEIGNFTELPTNSWVNLWFDADDNPSTGDDAGDEAVVRYLSTGELELGIWNGSQFALGSTAGIAASFDAGRLTVSVPRASVGAAGVFGLLAVSSRGQPVGDDEFIASDFAPDSERSHFTGPALTTFPDPSGDQDAAPDVTAVRVSDARNGWITFAITTPNYAVLPAESAVLVSIDADDNPRTGQSGADLELALVAGEVALARWDGQQFVPDDLPTRARHRNAGNVVSIDLHVSELDNSGRFRFSVTSVDFNSALQSFVAVDVAPDGAGSWRYALVNKPALKLVITRRTTSAARPRAGSPFTVGLAVARSDTRRPIATGAVVCNVRVAGKKVAARGRLASGVGRCTFDVPANARGAAVRGSITVRSSGKAVSASFAFVAGS
jgi:hypothetical protein